MKFLYLADLYHARAKGGRTLTGFPWAFVNYGPYCKEAYRAIEEAAEAGLVDTKRISSQYANNDEYRIHECQEKMTASMRESVPDEIRSLLNAAIKKLGDDTPALLDYVYFATEPMEGVKRGDLLDFSKSRSIEPAALPTPARLSADEIAKAKALTKALGERMKKARRRLKEDETEAEKWKDAVYYQNLDQIEEEELKPGVSGVAAIVDANPSDISRY
jgi:hypothetical protein